MLFEHPTSHLTIKRLLSIAHGIAIFLLCSALCHILGINVLDVSLNPPDVTKWVAHTSTSVPPEHARHLGHRGGSSRERLMVNGIAIRNEEAQEARGLRPLLFRVKRHDDRVADFELGMADGAILNIDTPQRLCPKRLFHEIEQFGRVS